MFLTEDEIKELTGRKHHRAQREQLNALGIVHKVRADGSLIVLVEHVQKELGVVASKRTPKNPEPNWGAI